MSTQILSFLTFFRKKFEYLNSKYLNTFNAAVGGALAPQVHIILGMAAGGGRAAGGRAAAGRWAAASQNNILEVFEKKMKKKKTNTETFKTIVWRFLEKK